MVGSACSVDLIRNHECYFQYFAESLFMFCTCSERTAYAVTNMEWYCVDHLTGDPLLYVIAVTPISACFFISCATPSVTCILLHVKLYYHWYSNRSLLFSLPKTSLCKVLLWRRQVEHTLSYISIPCSSSS